MIISVFDRVEKIVGKGEIACTSNFSLSCNVFKRLLFQTCQKVSLCGNGLITTTTTAVTTTAAFMTITSSSARITLSIINRTATTTVVATATRSTNDNNNGNKTLTRD